MAATVGMVNMGAVLDEPVNAMGGKQVLPSGGGGNQVGERLAGSRWMGGGGGGWKGGVGMAGQVPRKPRTDARDTHHATILVCFFLLGST